MNASPRERALADAEDAARLGVWIATGILGLTVLVTSGELVLLRILAASGDVDDGLFGGLIAAHVTLQVTGALVRIAAAVYWIRWSWRLADELRELLPSWRPPGRKALAIWWFVPVANFVRPFQLTMQLEDALQRAANPSSVPGVDPKHSMIARVWWGAWLVSNVGGLFVKRLARHADSVDASVFSLGASVFFGVLGVVAGVAAVRLVMHYGAQLRAAWRLRAEAVS